MVNAWEGIFKKRGLVFDKPHPDMPRVASLLRKRAARKILDLGCGTGRHSIYLAKKLYDVSGFDESSEALRQTKMLAESKGLKVKLKQGSIYKRLPYHSSYFDGVIATNIIHHGMRYEVKAAVEEIVRVLKHKGILFATFPKDVGRKNKKWIKKARKIAPSTFFPTKGPEAGLIHFVFDKASIYEIFCDFDLKIWEDNTHHWCVLGEKE